MEHLPTRTDTGWQRFDHAAFGLVYGAITVLSILLAVGDHASEALRTAFVLFGSVFVITVAKAFAELLSHALSAGKRQSNGSWAMAWRHSRSTLAVANLPTLFFLVAAAGWISTNSAVLLSQIVCIALLVVVGGRVGWVLDEKPIAIVLGGVFAGALGTGLAVVKFVIH